jgi:ankyrin repeat protein
MESFIPKGDPMLPETLWDIYSKWQVGSRGAVIQYIVEYFQKAMEKTIGFKSPQVKIIDDTRIQAIFSFERRGVGYFDGWEIYRTGEDEYYIKTVVLPEALAPLEIKKSPQTPKPISILLALQKKSTIGHKIKPKSSIPIAVIKKRNLSKIKMVSLIIVSGCICIIVEIILMAIIVNHIDNRQKIQKQVVTEPKRYEQEQGNQGMAASLIREGANVNVQSQYEDTPLHKAARLGDIFKIKQLLEQGADINAQDKQQNTPLHVAAYHGKTEAISLLIRRGADANARNSFEETPLFYAASQGKTEAASLLIQKGANINERDLSKNTPLHYAASHGNIEIVRLLIQKGVDINAQNIRRETPLHLAVYWGHKEVSVLLEQRRVIK